MFPSPCGEKIGINRAQEQGKEELPEVEFPSPCGEKIGINPFWVILPANLRPGFRPLAGKR